MKTDNHNGEAIIRQAFYRSLLAILVAIIAGYAIYHYIRSEDQPKRVVQPEINTPVARHQAAVKIPEVRFKDITQEAGIDFVHTNGAYGDRLLPETMGSGGGFIDYDNDGDQDIILINATYWPSHQQQHTPVTRLYNNDGNGHFKDVSTMAGLAINSYGAGLVVGDYDNDGWDDVYITTLGKNYLLHN
ncbi:MAG: VCBS repeat-containing protein, partial [Gammaproteobacteria bacterium]